MEGNNGSNDNESELFKKHRYPQAFEGEESTKDYLERKKKMAELRNRLGQPLKKKVA